MGKPTISFMIESLIFIFIFLNWTLKKKGVQNSGPGCCKNELYSPLFLLNQLNICSKLMNSNCIFLKSEHSYIAPSV